MLAGVLLLTPLIAAVPAKKSAPRAGFDGAQAYGYTRAVVALGPRPVGSQPHAAAELYIESQVKLQHAELASDAFTAQSPAGKVGMKNIIARLPGTSGRIIAFTGHYDTKKMPGFWGANDGGSSTGFLIELLRVLAKEKHHDDIYVVWLDGEEAFKDWTAQDSVQGSRHLEEKWARDGTLSHIEALFNVDMIGDKDLGILKDSNSSQALVKMVWDTARSMGLGKYFLETSTAMEDDHLPFVRAGVNAIDLIDFDYGPGNSLWHSSKDVMDKLSPHSFQVVGDVLTEVLKKLEATPVRQ